MRMEEMEEGQVRFAANMRALRHIQDGLPDDDIVKDIQSFYGYTPEQAAEVLADAQAVIKDQKELAAQTDYTDEQPYEQESYWTSDFDDGWQG